MVIVHDGDDRLQSKIDELVANLNTLDIHVGRFKPGLSLGQLRNESISLSKYEVVCQWDDDDLYHPDRLVKQYDALTQSGADFCFLGDQLHYFTNEAYFFWDDWSLETFPRDLIQGSLMGYKSLIGEYPDKVRGEDTDLVLRLLSEGRSLHRLSGCAWLYIYSYHGANAWEESHHKAISHIKRMRHRELQEKLPELTSELKAFAWKFDSMYFPHEAGGSSINLENDEQ
jgi:glycosyltransferase involved in cell wall biosynthesis